MATVLPNENWSWPQFIPLRSGSERSGQLWLRFNEDHVREWGGCSEREDRRAVELAAGARHHAPTGTTHEIDVDTTRPFVIHAPRKNVHVAFDIKQLVARPFARLAGWQTVARNRTHLSPRADHRATFAGHNAVRTANQSHARELRLIVAQP